MTQISKGGFLDGKYIPDLEDLNQNKGVVLSQSDEKLEDQGNEKWTQLGIQLYVREELERIKLLEA